MVFAADSADFDRDAALAALAWQVDLGLFEATGDVALNRYDLPDAVPAQPRADRPLPGVAPGPGAPPPQPADAAGLATAVAAACPTLEALCDAMVAFAPCELRLGARNLLFSDGDPAAPLMILADAPGREDDSEGRAFTGAPGL